MKEYIIGILKEDPAVMDVFSRGLLDSRAFAARIARRIEDESGQPVSDEYIQAVLAEIEIEGKPFLSQDIRISELEAFRRLLCGGVYPFSCETEEDDHTENGIVYYDDGDEDRLAFRIVRTQKFDGHEAVSFYDTEKYEVWLWRFEDGRSQISIKDRKDCWSIEITRASWHFEHYRVIASL